LLSEAIYSEGEATELGTYLHGSVESGDTARGASADECSFVKTHYTDVDKTMNQIKSKSWRPVELRGIVAIHRGADNNAQANWN